MAPKLQLAAVFAIHLVLAAYTHGDRVIGLDDRVNVESAIEELPSNLRRLLPAVGVMDNHCTASHIGNGLVLTAGHCLRAGLDEESKDSCDSIQVMFYSSAQKSHCKRILKMRHNENLDYGVFEVNVFPDARLEPAQQDDSFHGTQMTLLGFPANGDYRWSRACQLRSLWSSLPFAHSDFGHDCDTEVGNSGSPILIWESGALVGIHAGGNSDINYGTFWKSISL